MQYKEEQNYIAANKDNFEKLIKQEQDEMAKQMPSTFWGAAAAMMGPPPGVPPADAALAAPVTPTTAPPAVPTTAPTAFGVLSGVRGGETTKTRGCTRHYGPVPRFLRIQMILD